jgi:hypothetical protein
MKRMRMVLAVMSGLCLLVALTEGLPAAQYALGAMASIN